MLISVVVPCYNEEEMLPVFLKEFKDMCKNLDYELWFVNDGSIDGTLEVLRGFSAKDERIHYLSFSRNFGKESAIFAGLCNAGGDYVTVMDADLQDPPELLSRMADILAEGRYDCVAAKRVSRKGEPIVRSLLSKGFYKLINKISDVKIVDGARDYRLIAMSEYNRFSKGIFDWVGFKTHWISYENVERKAGKTKWNIFGLIKYAVDGFFNFSQAPLRIVSSLGVLVTFFAFVYIIYIVYSKYVNGYSIEGWTSMTSIILFLGGLQLLSIGIIGQYIARIFLETKNRPHYIVSESDKDNIIKIR